MAAAIVTDKLSKHYPGTKEIALDKLSLTVNAGEVYGFLGANGAGKSTTIRLLLNFLQPTSGTAQIGGFDVVHESRQAKTKVGYLAGDIALYKKPTGAELLHYLGDLQGSDYKEYLKILAKRFEAPLGKKIGEMSKGNRQKIGLLQALMHRPDVIILDEPTSGLDPLMQEVFYSTIREHTKAGAAVFMSSHNLAEAQQSCDRIGIIKHGKLIHEQAINEQSALSKPTFTIVLASEPEAIRLAHSSGLKVVHHQGNTLQIRPTVALPAFLRTLSNFQIVSLTTTQLNLEDEFMEFYGRGK